MILSASAIYITQLPREFCKKKIQGQIYFEKIFAELPRQLNNYSLQLLRELNNYLCNGIEQLPRELNNYLWNCTIAYGIAQLPRELHNCL
jgi:hypothetical protein